MAGVDQDGQQWGVSYNSAAYQTVGMFEDIHSTLNAYGSALNDIGFRHALGDASLNGTSQPERPTDPAVPAFGPYSIPASAGGPGHGIIDSGMNIASQVGIPVPDGDTGKLARAADAWDRLGTIYQNTNARDKITISATLFDDVTSPDAVHIRDDLRTLSNSIDQLLTSCKQLGESCLAYREALKELRDEIKGLLEGLVKDLAIDAGITIAAAVISFGAGAVAGAKAVDTVRRWAKRIADGIILWRARKAAQIAGRTQDAKDALAKASKAVRDIFDRLRKKGDEVKRPPKKPLREELDNAQVTTDRRITIDNGPPNGYIVKRDSNGNITNYVQFDEHGRGIKRVDLTGRAHGSVPTPHVVEMDHNIAPDGKVHVREQRGVRPARPDELP
ncbi:polymorphic toxin type 24 domain-containing protein [Nocardia wallacei]|uniref:polymorphic toxin type 24 domain-containing protein n=1 Tax=Nocardia wallacei TaxID=480035 RepID=UPI002455D7BE|nr:polymorphic toxin type 24 domain-containing protein [Nocardia wallacei]